MSSTYHLTEPHPSVPKTNYIYSGRGGAGNIRHVDATALTDGQTATGPASRVKLPSHSPTAYFTAGRGGAGNVHREKERAIFSFDEELERQRKMMEHQAPVYHVGRGGAGNLVDELHPRSTRSGSADSTISNDSSRPRRSIDTAMNRLSRAFSRQ
jgi:hypothetical protein